ncbi:MAG TPA: hypothetical protein VF456_21385 [Vicinamibacterales bacterium]
MTWLLPDSVVTLIANPSGGESIHIPTIEELPRAWTNPFTYIRSNFQFN